VFGQLKKGCIRVRPEMAQDIVVNSQRPQGEGVRLKTLRYGYNKGKNQGGNPKSQDVLLKA